MLRKRAIALVVTVCAAVAVSACSGSPAGPAASSGKSGSSDLQLPKVNVCHRTGNGSIHVISVSANALPAHLAHGDTQGGVCGIVGDTN